MEASTVQQILDSAERAASSEDFPSAKSLLRKAARLQESSLGAEHPDLASTFNNLAIVCEKANDLAAAGEFYERAFSIASASLDSEHPLVIMSRDNFNEFQRVHGTAPPTRGRRLTMVFGAIGAIVLVGALAIWFIATPSHQTTAADNPLEQPVPQPVPSAARSRTVVRRSTDVPPRVVEASLCQSLSTTGAQWQCAPVSDAAVDGSLYFYTRIATAKSTRLHHRWYRNGRLRRDVDLAIQANPSAGYRTYSRQRLASGDWRVDAVTAEGVVLHEARVAIR
jgi:Protein of unknown function (DUF2914)/Tetratricopeptide repeat